MLLAEGPLTARRQLQVDILDAETRLTPKEYWSFIRSLRLDPAAKDLVEANETRVYLKNKWWLRRYRRVDLTDHVTLYKGRRSASGRGLLIGIAAFYGRMTVPTPVFLQSLSPRHWDVLIVRDPSQNQFRRGSAGFGDDIPKLAHRITEVAAPYGRSVVLGTSMGGLAAIRLALLCPGTRGISIGGVRALDVRRMYSDPFPGLAYDPLCDCLPKLRRDLWFLHGSTHVQDKKVAGQYAQTTRGHRFAVPDCPSHAVFAHLWRQGRLEPFLAALLDTSLSPKALRQRLTAIKPLRLES